MEGKTGTRQRKMKDRGSEGRKEGGKERKKERRSGGGKEGNKEGRHPFIEPLVPEAHLLHRTFYCRLLFYD